MRERPPTRTIDTIVRPIDKFARDARGRPLRADEQAGSIRFVGATQHSELVSPDSALGIYWVVSPLWAHDSVDFHLLRQSLRSHGQVGMGVVSGARPGAGAVLLVPTVQGFALHAIDRGNPVGPFDKPFSQRKMTLLVDNWTNLIVAGGLPVRASASALTEIWGRSDR